MVRLFGHFPGPQIHRDVKFAQVCANGTGVCKLVLSNLHSGMYLYRNDAVYSRNTGSPDN